jgi:hypothetical protein
MTGHSYSLTLEDEYERAVWERDRAQSFVDELAAKLAPRYAAEQGPPDADEDATDQG